MIVNITKEELQNLIAVKTVSVIAQDFGCDKNYIQRALKKFGISSPRARISTDYSGRVFGSWTVVRKLSDRHASWICKCSCGSEKSVKSCNLLSGKSSKCMNCTRKGCGEITGTIWSNILNGANQRGLLVSVSVEEAWELYKSQHRKCALTGMKIDFKPRGDTRSNTTASLDRINSSKGYEQNNLQWVYKKINMMKQAYSNEEFIELCKMVAKNNG